jgi:PAS domain S-box-containing protein
MYTILHFKLDFELELWSQPIRPSGIYPEIDRKGKLSILKFRVSILSFPDRRSHASIWLCLDGRGVTSTTAANLMDTDLISPGFLSTSLEDTCLTGFLQNQLIAAFLTVDGHIMGCTAKFQSLFNSTERFDELIHSDDLFVDAELKHKLIKGTISRFRTEKRLIDKNQQERWFEIEFSQIESETVQSPLLAVVLNEITENRRLYDALLWSERRWRDLLHHSLLLFFQCDDGANLLYCTPRMAQLLQIQPEAWLGQSIAELIHPEDIEEFLRFFEENLGGCHSSLICRFNAQNAQWLELRLEMQMSSSEASVILHAQDLSLQFALLGQIQFYRSQYKNLLRQLAQMLSL